MEETPETTTARNQIGKELHEARTKLAARKLVQKISKFPWLFYFTIKSLEFEIYIKQGWIQLIKNNPK